MLIFLRRLIRLLWENPVFSLNTLSPIYPKPWLPSRSSCSKSSSWLWAKSTKASPSESLWKTKSWRKWESPSSPRTPTTSSQNSKRRTGRSFTRSTRSMATKIFWVGIWWISRGTPMKIRRDRMKSRIVTISLIWSLTIIRGYPTMTKNLPRKSSVLRILTKTIAAPSQTKSPPTASSMTPYRLGRRSRNSKSKWNRKTISLVLWHFWLSYLQCGFCSKIRARPKENWSPRAPQKTRISRPHMRKTLKIKGLAKTRSPAKNQSNQTWKSCERRKRISKAS